jgi:hypothetical protein
MWESGFVRKFSPQANPAIIMFAYKEVQLLFEPGRLFDVRLSQRPKIFEK